MPIINEWKERDIKNGRIPKEQLEVLGDKWKPNGHNVAMQKDAAKAFRALSQVFYEKFGVHIRITSERTAYRDFNQQVDIKAQEGNLAATPGQSPHGWGLSFDASNIGNFSSERQNWIQENAINYGFARSAGLQNKGESWHLDFVLSVWDK